MELLIGGKFISYPSLIGQLKKRISFRTSKGICILSALESNLPDPDRRVSVRRDGPTSQQMNMRVNREGILSISIDGDMLIHKNVFLTGSNL